MLELNVGFGGSAGVDNVSPTVGPEAKPPFPPYPEDDPIDGPPLIPPRFCDSIFALCNSLAFSLIFVFASRSCVCLTA